MKFSKKNYQLNKNKFNYSFVSISKKILDNKIFNKIKIE